MPETGGLYYEIHGADDAPPLILSSGLGGSASYWQPNIAALTAGYRGGYRVITYDHRGTGRSDRALPDVVTVADLADDIRLLMDALDLPSATIIGHAAGAVAALSLALSAPERVERIVSVNGWAKADPRFLDCFAIRRNLLRSAGAEAYLRAQPIFLYPGGWFYGRDQAAHDADVAAGLAHFPSIATMEKRIDALAAFDIADRLGEITTPVLAIAAYDDLLVPWQASQRLYNGLPNATYAFMRYGAHALNVTDPERFAEITLLWLAGEPITEE